MYIVLFLFALAVQAGTPPQNPIKSFPDHLRVTENLWKEESVSMEKDFQRDVLLLYTTLFPPVTHEEFFYAEKDGDIIRKRQENIRLLLKRLLLAYTYSGIKMTEEKNGTSFIPFPYPLASIFSHGGRVLIVADGSSKEFLDFLQGGTSFIDHRIAASHGIIEKKGRLIEEKLGIFKTHKNLMHGLQKKHHGLNIPYGGIGNIRLDGRFIGPDGFAYVHENGTFVKDETAQHGHMYIFADTFGDKAGLLIGIETNAAGTVDMFGVKHNALSAIKNSSVSRSVSGGLKWKKYTSPVPSKYGGIRVHITSKDIDKVIQTLQHINALPRDTQKKLFQDLLYRAPDEGKKLLETVMKETESKISKKI